MSANKVVDPIRVHGTSLDKQSNRVRCNYCDKVVPGFRRLKYHLAGIRGDVSPCEKVHADLRAQIRDALRESIIQKFDEQPEPARKRMHKSAKPPSVWSILDDIKPTTVADEGNNIGKHLKEVKSSWKNTGCSILLNGWTSKKGRNLLIFLVDCPQGTMYLKSVDISDWVRNVDTLFSLFDGVVKEVGIENVIQVVVYDNSSTYIEAAGKKIVEKHQSIFWTPCAAHCVNLMLEEIGKIDHVRKILDKAIDIATFTHDHQVMKLTKMQTRGMEVSDKSKPDMLFLLLQNIVCERENLRNMLSLSEWNNSIWAFTKEANRVADTVRDPSFWAGANEALKATVPLLHLLSLIDDYEKPPMGYIYDAIDKAKETIRENLGGDKAKYTRIWIIIDAVWNNQLHSPLHSTGYMLNPAIFYSSHYYADSEVSSGLMCCIERMVPDLIMQNFLFLQLDEYKGEEGGFASETAIKQRTTSLPDEWWLTNGGCSPQLQQFAIRILSQTCSCKARICELIKYLIEELHAGKGGNKRGQQRPNDKVFADANLVLLDSRSAGGSKKHSKFVEEIYVPAVGDSKRDSRFFNEILETKDGWNGSEGSKRNLRFTKEIDATTDDSDSDEDVTNERPTVIQLDDSSGLEDVDVDRENRKNGSIIQLDDSDSSGVRGR